MSALLFPLNSKALRDVMRNHCVEIAPPDRDPMRYSLLYTSRLVGV